MLTLALIAVFLVTLRISGYMYAVGNENYTHKQRLVGGLEFATANTFLFYYFT